MKRKEKIDKICSKGNPFKVPENYFHNLTEEVMAKLPEKKSVPVEEFVKVTLWTRVRPWIYMAAVFAGMLLGFRFMLEHTTDSQPIPVIAVTNYKEDSEWDDEYLEAIIDHSMMDDYTLYIYLTEVDGDLY
ncbi:MAG: hypothetical protein LUE93_02095, partial [Bacteroides sp.]|nr:hypothetical protein [Bacteroides sp.]